MTYAITTTSADLFLSDDLASTDGMILGRSNGAKYEYGLVKASSGKVKTWPVLWQAQATAEIVGGKVVTAPSCSGGFWTWSEVEV